MFPSFLATGPVFAKSNGRRRQLADRLRHLRTIAINAGLSTLPCSEKMMLGRSVSGRHKLSRRPRLPPDMYCNCEL
jgi:hypothetical protein